jgi:hypothetical protein
LNKADHHVGLFYKALTTFIFKLYYLILEVCTFFVHISCLSALFESAGSLSKRIQEGLGFECESATKLNETVRNSSIANLEH